MNFMAPVTADLRSAEPSPYAGRQVVTARDRASGDQDFSIG